MDSSRYPKERLVCISESTPSRVVLRCGAQPWLLAGKMIDAALRNGLWKQIEQRSKFFKSIVKNGVSFPPTPDYGDQWLSAGTLLLLFVRHVLLSSEDSVSRDSEYIRRDCAAQPRTAGAEVITRLFASARRWPGKR